MALVLADRVWDGVADSPIDRGFVAMDRGAIVAVGRQADIGTQFEGDDRVELPPGATLLPGLIDCHQHLVFNCIGTLEEQIAGMDDDALGVRARESAAKALTGGITTLRDLGDRAFVTLALRDDPSLPTILAAGPPLTRVGGHCWYLGGECTGEEELRRAVHIAAITRVRRDFGALARSGVNRVKPHPTFPMWAAHSSLPDEEAVAPSSTRRTARSPGGRPLSWRRRHRPGARRRR